MVVFHTLDPAELDFTYEKNTVFEDLETQERLTCDPKEIAPAYAEVFGEFLAGYQKACREMQIDYRIIRTDQPLDTTVRAYLEERRRCSK